MARLEVHENTVPRAPGAVVLAFAGELDSRTFETFRVALTQRRPPQQRILIVDLTKLHGVVTEEVPRAATLLKLLRDESGRLLVVGAPAALARRLEGSPSERGDWVFADLASAEASLEHGKQTHRQPSSAPNDSGAAEKRASPPEYATESEVASAGERRHATHLEVFLGFCYGFFKNQTLAVPPGASAEGLAAVFADDAGRARVAEVLSTLALERLLRGMPLLPPEVLLGAERVVAMPWDEAFETRGRPAIHARTIYVLAHLFLVASRAFASVSFDDSKDGGRHMLELTARLIEEGRACRGVAQEQAWTGFLALAELEDAEPLALASLDSAEFAEPEEPLSLIDLLLLDEAVQMTHQGSIKLHRQVPELATAWRRLLAPLYLLSPLSGLTRMVERLSFSADETPFAEALGEPAPEALLEQLLREETVPLFAYLEAEIISAWCLEEERSRHRDTLRDRWIEVFTGTLERLFSLAERRGRVWMLGIVPRFYAAFFQKVSEQQVTRHVRARMVELTRLAERQSLIRSELALFEPLERFTELLQRLRELNWAERTAEQAYLIEQPFPMLARLRQSVQLCQEKLALPFGRIARD